MLYVLKLILIEQEELATFVIRFKQQIRYKILEITDFPCAIDLS
jgi:hypothetical protein